MISLNGVYGLCCLCFVWGYSLGLPLVLPFVIGCLFGFWLIWCLRSCLFLVWVIWFAFCPMGKLLLVVLGFVVLGWLTKFVIVVVIILDLRFCAGLCVCLRCFDLKFIVII